MMTKILRCARALFLIAATMMICAVPAAQCQDVVAPKLSGYATDLTGTLSASELAALNAKLEQFDKATSSQIVVLMIPTIGGGSLEEFSMQVAEKNLIGQKGRDNGAILLIVKNDRKIRIEVGYGLEGVLTDALTSQIIRREIGPRFKASDFASGVNAGVDAMILASRNEYKAEPKSAKGQGAYSPLVVILLILFVIFKILFSYRRGFGGLGGPRYYGGGWGGGGGFSGGSSGGGGFSGGGGSFGGGGSSGSW